jgi:hypothetical protein
VGIGRREFLRVCGNAFAAFAAASTDAIALVDDLYVNRRFGVAFKKPPGWHFADVKRLGELAVGQALASDDIQLSPDMLEWIGLPFIVVQRDPDATDAFTPCAQFFLLEDCPLLAQLDGLMTELAQLMGEQPEQFTRKPSMLKKAREDAEACAGLFKSFVLIERPAPMTLSKCPSAVYSAAYLFEHVELAAPVRVRVKTIFSLHAKLAYLIRLFDSPYGNLRNAFCFDSFVSSIAFV